MQQTLAIAAVAIGGAIGSVLRYLVSSWFLERAAGPFPWGTLTINISGSFAIGIVLELALLRSGLSPYVRLLLATGFLGGYTTFSAYAYEIVRLSTTGAALPAAGYALASVAGGIVAAYAGMLVTRTFAA